MSFRRPRSHMLGISNIDFRTKKDKENLIIFEPWLLPKDVGTMGSKNYKMPQSAYQKIFGPSEKINTYRDLVNDYPDPRFHSTAQFYKANNISLNTKTFINSQRVANLEESFKGKEVFNGDSTNIAEILRIRKGKKFSKKKLLIRNSMKEPFSFEDKKIQNQKIEKLSKDKKNINKNVIQETQLVKINSFMDKGDSKINMKKIEEIRITLRRRYANRKKIYKIFQQWAKTFPNKITAYDAYKMINALSIPINYNETKAFIASGSYTGNEYLTFEEFSNLIYEPTKMNLNDDKNFVYEEKEGKKINDKMISNNKLQTDEKNILKLKDFITQRLSLLNKNIKELSKEKYSFSKEKEIKNNTDLNFVDYNKFKKGILNLRPSDNLGKEEYIKKIFEEYKNENNLIDMRYFCENIFEKNRNEFINKMKEKTLRIIKDQFNEKKHKLQNYIKENVDKIKPLFFQKKIDLDTQIIQKKKILEDENKRDIRNVFEKQLNGTIPSSQWLHHIYDNRSEHFKILNRAEHALSAAPGRKVKINTRFSSVPTWRKTSEILIGNENCDAFISEKDRFIIDRDVNKEDKRKKNLNRIRRENRIKTTLKIHENNSYLKNFLEEEKNIYSGMEKSKRMAMYDETTKNRNFIFE